MRSSITVKLTVGFVVIVVLSMLSIGTIFIHIFQRYSLNSLERTMLERARHISGMMSEYFQNDGFMHGMGTGGFMHFLDNMSGAKVWITDREGKPVQLSAAGSVSGHKGANPLPLESHEVIQGVISGQESVSRSFSSFFNEAALTVGMPIKNSTGDVAGAVLLHTPVSGVAGTINNEVTIVLISHFASLIFVAAGLGLYYSLLFTRPLKAMNRTALEMTRGNYSARTGIQRRDEIGQLGHSLDLLASKLGITMNQLFQEKGKLNDIISSISEGIFALDDQMRPVSTNQALAGVMSRSIPYSFELLSRDLSNLNIKADFHNVMSNGKPCTLMKDWMGKKLRFTLAPIQDNKGTRSGCVALVQDISESERLEELRRDFVANVSHEFRTPLTVIRGSLEALVDSAVDQSEDIGRFHRRMLTETRGLERLVGDLLDLSKLQSGKITLSKEIVHMETLIADTIKSLEIIADKKSIGIAFTSPGDTPAVPGDYDRLRQLLIIFLDNAIQYSPENTTISINILHTAAGLEITVRDQGVGIAAEELPYIWDRFYKADKSRKSSGTGLGLAIAKHIIELHGGKVSVESRSGTGTTVALTLPTADSDRHDKG